eukprot:14162409-Alexandrium_andersonii.AAC.1
MRALTWETRWLPCGTSSLLQSRPCQSAHAAPASPGGKPSASPDARRGLLQSGASRSAAAASRRASAA